mmetsp:Transcript_15355/g.17060  ORF Transcript_15355/g.17060 Transcript_15355/m.17060 type:complete len:207 (+) Transcript_15355:46-666(+)
MTSVARLMPSTSDSRQPYRLSNFDLVTESLTLMDGIGSLPACMRLYRFLTPVVVSSEIPWILAAISGYLSRTRLVRSPPSSRIMLGWVSSPGKPRTTCSTHQSYSSSVSPFQAKTGTPALATAAAAASLVEKMLHEHHRTRAPRAVRVSMRTAVCTVMCRQPAMRAPARGLLSPNSRRSSIRPGISFSPSSISLRPHSARDMSLTL